MVFFILWPSPSLYSRNIWAYICLKGVALLCPSSTSDRINGFCNLINICYMKRELSHWPGAHWRHEMQACLLVISFTRAFSLWRENIFARVLLHKLEDQQWRPLDWNRWESAVLNWQAGSKKASCSFDIMLPMGSSPRMWSPYQQNGAQSCTSCPRQHSVAECRGIHRGFALQAFSMVNGAMVLQAWYPRPSSVPHGEAENRTDFVVQHNRCFTPPVAAMRHMTTVLCTSPAS